MLTQITTGDAIDDLVELGFSFLGAKVLIEHLDNTDEDPNWIFDAQEINSLWSEYGSLTEALEDLKLPIDPDDDESYYLKQLERENLVVQDSGVVLVGQ